MRKAETEDSIKAISNKYLSPILSDRAPISGLRKNETPSPITNNNAYGSKDIPRVVKYILKRTIVNP